MINDWLPAVAAIRSELAVVGAAATEWCGVALVLCRK
ncbi:hypothetical protein L195_g051979 [Trifolium pratense]|uniref:Uncharacterized protein n=1 Tax=Trifolium pratense TaxID=57577 RepID=A0A2K3K2Q5_TRIPR|nr:hypothetical protein L195_g051979 [Trifolium pratense]